MGYATGGSRNFLVEDPVWAADFAPNGALLKLGDLITRKRYAEYARGQQGVLAMARLTEPLVAPSRKSASGASMFFTRGK